MSRKPTIYSYQALSGVYNTTTTSEITKVDLMDQASIDLQWSASTLNATLEVQVRNGANGTWRALDFGSPITISGASGSHDIVILTMPFIDMRLVLTVTSGSGTVSAVLTAKATGA